MTPSPTQHRVDAGEEPVERAVEPDRTHLGTDAGIAEVDTSSEAGAVYRTVVPVGGPVTSFAITPDTAWIYAATGTDVVAIDRASGPGGHRRTAGRAVAGHGDRPGR